MNGERNAARKKQAKRPYRLHARKEQALVEVDSKEGKWQTKKRKNKKKKRKKKRENLNE